MFLLSLLIPKTAYRFVVLYNFRKTFLIYLNIYNESIVD